MSMKAFVKPYELAKSLGVKPHAIYRWIREGKILAAETKKVTITKERIVVDGTLTIETIKKRMTK